MPDSIQQIQATAAEPVLKHPDPNATFVIQADGSDVAVGAAYSKRMPRTCYNSVCTPLKKLTETEQRWAVWEKEAYVVWWTLLAWRHFLEGEKTTFEVWTDHKNLEALKTPCKLSPKQVHWAQYFNWFNFTLRYIPGGKNFMVSYW